MSIVEIEKFRNKKRPIYYNTVNDCLEVNLCYGRLLMMYNHQQLLFDIINDVVKNTVPEEEVVNANNMAWLTLIHYASAIELLQLQYANYGKIVIVEELTKNTFSFDIVLTNPGTNNIKLVFTITAPKEDIDLKDYTYEFTPLQLSNTNLYIDKIQKKLDEHFNNTSYLRKHEYNKKLKQVIYSHKPTSEPLTPFFYITNFVSTEP
jgi:hypothetical protein